jgi:hypothetical protein
MRIVTRPDLSGFAPPECAYYAIDDDTYDGPRSPIGTGPTEPAAIADLLEQREDEGAV